MVDVQGEYAGDHAFWIGKTNPVAGDKNSDASFNGQRIEVENNGD